MADDHGVESSQIACSKGGLSCSFAASKKSISKNILQRLDALNQTLRSPLDEPKPRKISKSVIPMIWVEAIQPLLSN